MKKFLVVIALVLFAVSCEKSNVSEEESLANIDNQIQAVDGTKIKRPGSGGNGGS